MITGAFWGLGGLEVIALLALALVVVAAVLLSRGCLRVFLVVLAALGVAALTGGLLAFAFGAWVARGPVWVSGLGPFNGTWSPEDYCFLGAGLAAGGAGLATGGFLGLRARDPA